MAVNPYDEPAIEGPDVIIRRVDRDHHVVTDKSTGELRIASKLFSPSSGPDDGMSVDIEKLIRQAGLDPQAFVKTSKYEGAVCFSAQAARNLGLKVGYDPIKDIPGLLDNPYHGEVWGPPDKPNKFTRVQKKALMLTSNWFVELPGVTIS